MVHRSVVRGPYEVLRTRDVSEEARPVGNERVVLQSENPWLVLQAGELPTSGMHWFLRKRRGTYLIVDVGIRSSQISGVLDSEIPGLQFTCTAHVNWRVTDPVAAVEHLALDIPKLLTAGVLRTLGTVSRGWRMTQMRELEDAIDRADLVRSVNTGLDFVEVTAVIPVIGYDPAWEKELRARELAREADKTLQEAQIAANASLDEERGGAKTVVMAQDPQYARELEAHRMRGVTDEQESAREQAALARDLERLNAMADIAANDMELRARILLIAEKLRSSETEKFEHQEIFESLIKPFKNGSSVTQLSDQINRLSAASPDRRGPTDEHDLKNDHELAGHLPDDLHAVMPTEPRNDSPDRGEAEEGAPGEGSGPKSQSADGSESRTTDEQS